MSDPQPQEPPVRDFVDRALRDLLSQAANLRGFLGEVVPDLVENFDFEKMRPRAEEEQSKWQHVAEQVPFDERQKKEANMAGMTIADAIRREGKAEGKVEAMLRQGRKKWSEPNAATLQAIQAIHDEARLNRMIDAMFDVQSWADLLNVT